jgi:hypothetical protein
MWAVGRLVWLQFAASRADLPGNHIKELFKVSYAVITVIIRRFLKVAKSDY